MKIRQGFVTNSSSSSFIVVSIKTKDGNNYRAEYNSGDGSMWGEKAFNPSKQFFEELKSGEELINSAFAWFKGTFADTCLPEEFDYSEGDVDEIKDLLVENIEKIELESMIDYEDYAIGYDISYDYKTKKKKRTKTGYDFNDY